MVTVACYPPRGPVACQKVLDEPFRICVRIPEGLAAEEWRAVRPTPRLCLVLLETATEQHYKEPGGGAKGTEDAKRRARKGDRGHRGHWRILHAAPGCEVRQLCRNVVGKLARKRPSPLLPGGLQIWASGAIYALASQNFLFDKAQPMHLNAQELGDLLGVKKTTMGNKGAIVRNLLKIGMMDPEFTDPDLLRDNPLTWMLLIDGLAVDVRQLPVQFQRRAFDMGLIPYVPGEEATDG